MKQRKKIIILLIVVIVAILGFVLINHKNLSDIIPNKAYTYNLKSVDGRTVTGGLAFDKKEKYSRYSDLNDFYDDQHNKLFDYESGSYQIKNKKKLILSDGINQILPYEIQITDIKINGQTIKGRVLNSSGDETYGTITLTRSKK